MGVQPFSRLLDTHQANLVLPPLYLSPPLPLSPPLQVLHPPPPPLRSPTLPPPPTLAPYLSSPFLVPHPTLHIALLTTWGPSHQFASAPRSDKSLWPLWRPRGGGAGRKRRRPTRRPETAALGLRIGHTKTGESRRDTPMVLVAMLLGLEWHWL